MSKCVECKHLKKPEPFYWVCNTVGLKFRYSDPATMEDSPCERFEPKVEETPKSTTPTFTVSEPQCAYCGDKFPFHITREQIFICRECGKKSKVETAYIMTGVDHE